MNYQQQTVVATDSRFIKKVQQASLDYALTISTEASSGDVPVDNARLNLAKRVITDPQNFARDIAYAVVTDPRASDNLSDATILAIVSDQWNAYAGTKPAV